MIQSRNDDARGSGVFAEAATDYEAYVRRATLLMGKATELLVDACSMRSRLSGEVAISAHSTGALVDAARDLGHVVRRMNDE